MKSKELARLLQSKNPQDLEQANRLIKTMVKQVSQFLFLIEVFVEFCLIIN